MKSGSPSAPSPLAIGGTPQPSARMFPSTGEALIGYIAEQYPDRLRGGVSLEERVANMEFLRDRMIEAGICGGMDMGWNMKRGGPEKSKDFVAWHDGNQRLGVDIARAYDAAHRQLQLTWNVHGPTPHYREYQPRPDCG